MDIKLISIIAFTYAYGFFELFMGLRQKRDRKIAKSGDRFSIWIMGICIANGYSLSFYIGSNHIGRMHHWDTFFAIGAGLVIIGLIVRIKSILTLNKQFTFTVSNVEDHELIETGIYKFIRHPGYLGQLIIFIGISTTLSNWLSILLMMIPVLVGYMYRIIVEENFMIKQMGQKYIDYQKRTKRLIPAIY